VQGDTSDERLIVVMHYRFLVLTPSQSRVDFISHVTVPMLASSEHIAFTAVPEKSPDSFQCKFTLASEYTRIPAILNDFRGKPKITSSKCSFFGKKNIPQWTYFLDRNPHNNF